MTVENGRERWRFALAAALFTALLVLPRLRIAPSFPSDLDQIWFAARALVAGKNPYEAVGPGRVFAWEWAVFYPLPAILLVAPFTILPVTAARFVFSIVAGATLGYAMGTRWRLLWPLFLSQAFFLAVSRNQWSPFMLAAIWLPAIGFVAAAKPNIGLVAIAGQQRHTVVRVVMPAAAVVILSFLIRPSWFGEWLELVRSAPNKEMAFLQPGGLILLSALLLWRTTEGRILITTGIVPQTPSVYDALLLFPICQTRAQATLLALLTHLAQISALHLGPYESHDDYYDAMAKILVLIVMIPALGLAFYNRFTTRKDSLTTAVVDGGGKRDAAFTSLTEAVLLFGLFLIFLLNWWIIYAPW
jgi:hypothetical protein